MEPTHCSTGRASPSGRIRGHVTRVAGQLGAVFRSPKLTNRDVLLLLTEAIQLNNRLQVHLLKGIHTLANDFSKATAALDALAAVITQVIFDLNNPETNNSDQATIDSITARLQGAVDSLTAADAAAKAKGTPAPVSDPVAPSDGTGSTDVTP